MYETKQMSYNTREKPIWNSKVVCLTTNPAVVTNDLNFCLTVQDLLQISFKM